MDELEPREFDELRERPPHMPPGSPLPFVGEGASSTSYNTPP